MTMALYLGVLITHLRKNEPMGRVQKFLHDFDTLDPKGTNVKLESLCHPFKVQDK